MGRVSKWAPQHVSQHQPDYRMRCDLEAGVKIMRWLRIAPLRGCRGYQVDLWRSWNRLELGYCTDDERVTALTDFSLNDATQRSLIQPSGLSVCLWKIEQKEGGKKSKELWLTKREQGMETIKGGHEERGAAPKPALFLSKREQTGEAM